MTITPTDKGYGIKVGLPKTESEENGKRPKPRKQSRDEQEITQERYRHWDDQRKWWKGNK